MSKTSKFAIAAFLGAGLVAGIAAASAEPATTPPASPDKSMMQDGMMQGGMMQGGMMQGGMMPMMQEMSKMMGNCNKMMQTMMDHQNQGGSGQQSPDKRG
ncbi:hypothetical protein [Methylobacterium sp. DCY52]|jgi:hypothetical protein|uniref:hypothetical protein n=1 Tax=Methylobacterium sp. DCY52 TaxID=739139 RepID=UPI0031452136